MNSKAFTLIELIVVTAIIVLLTTLILSNYRAGDRQFALQRSAHKLAQDLRRVQEMAVSVQEFEGTMPGGYGLYLNKNQPAQYLIFADLNGDQRYSELVDGLVEEISLEKRINISGLSPLAHDSSLTITFVPPDPTTVFYPEAAVSLITIGTEELQKTIQVNRAGLITIN